MRLARREIPWLAALAVSLTVGLIASWQRWGSPLVDCGREMNQPLRLLQGERLYAEVAHLYGPLSPYANAALYRLFGAHLVVLVGHGLVVTVLVLGLTYWIARQIMGRPASTLVAFGVTWLCALKPSGNYVLPYAYAALDGCGLGLLALALAVRFLQTGRSALLAVAGSAAGLACLAKAEIGLAAAASVAVAAWLGAPSGRRRVVGLFAGLAPAAALVGAGYGAVAASVGWTTLAHEGYLWPHQLPPALVFYNKRMFGFDDPLGSLVQMIVVALRMSLLAAGIAWAALAGARSGRNDEAAAPARRRARLLTLGLAVLVAVTSRQAGWDMGPFLAVPFLLVGVLALELTRARRGLARRGRVPLRTALVILIAAAALAALARSLLRVRSGGAYSSFLLPAAVVVFAYGWTHLLPALVPGPTARRSARRLALGVLSVWIGATAVVTVYRYHKYFQYTLRTPRGTMRVLPDQGLAFDQALAFLVDRTSPGDTVAVLPEGTALDFFAGRKNPLNEEITTPGLLDEGRAILRLEETRTPVILITNRPTVEFGAPIFGRDYHQRLMGWIEGHYETCGLFGPGVSPEIEIGAPRFFIRAYCRPQRATTLCKGI